MNYGPNKIYAYLKGNREFSELTNSSSTRDFFKEPNTVGITSKYLYENGRPTEIIIGNSKNIKLANADAFDDAGNLIPLSQRDNFMINDIRGEVHNLYNHPEQFIHPAEAVRTGKYSSKSRSFPAKDIAPEEQTPSILGPRDWLSSWTGKSGKEVTLSESELSQLFNTTKEDVRKYIFSDEFKQRVMNTGQFTENEYKDLTKVLNERLNQTKFGGLADEGGAVNTYYSFPSGEIDLSKGFEVKVYPTHSITQHRTHMWHELWHSLGGTKRTDPDPLIQRLAKYNNETRWLN